MVNTETEWIAMKNCLVKTIGMISLFTLTGCATVMNGTTESYLVTSEPAGAEVQLSTGETCITPCILDKKRNSEFTVNIEKQGYKPHAVVVTNHISEAGAAAIAGDLIMIGSVVWLGIDTVSGATKELSPNPCAVILEPAENQPEF